MNHRHSRINRECHQSPFAALFVVFIFAALSATTLACDTEPTNQSPTSSIVVNSEGGEFVDESTGVRFIIPPGAVAGPTRIRVERIYPESSIAAELPSDAAPNGAWRLEGDVDTFKKKIALGFPLASASEANQLVAPYVRTATGWSKAQLLNGSATVGLTSKDGLLAWVATDHLSDWGVGTRFDIFYADPFAPDFIMLPTGYFSESWASGIGAFAFMHDTTMRTKVYSEVIMELVTRSERLRAEQEVAYARLIAGGAEELSTVKDLAGYFDTLGKVSEIAHLAGWLSKGSLNSVLQIANVFKNLEHLDEYMVVADCVRDFLIDLAVLQAVDYGMVRDRYAAFRQMTIGSTLYDKDPAFRTALDSVDANFGTMAQSNSNLDAKIAETIATWLAAHATEQCVGGAIEELSGQFAEIVLPALAGLAPTPETQAAAGLVWSYLLKDVIFKDLVASGQKALVLAALGTIWHRGISPQASADLFGPGLTEPLPPTIAYGRDEERSKWMIRQNFLYLMESIRWMARDAINLQDTSWYNQGLNALLALLGASETRANMSSALEAQRADYAMKVDLIAQSIPSGCEEANDGTLVKFCAGESIVLQEPTYLAQNLRRPGDIAVTTTRAYWTDQGAIGSMTGAVGASDKLGGSTNILANGLDEPHRIDVTSDSVYFTTSWDSVTGNIAGVWRLDVSGGTPILLVQHEGADAPRDLVVDGEFVFYSTHYGVHVISTSGESPTTLFENGADISRIALDSDFVYWTEYDGGFVRRIPKSGGVVTTVASGIDHPQGVAVDDEYLYFAERGVGGGQCLQPGLGKIHRVAKSGGNMVTLVTTNGCEPNEVAIDDDYIYWAEFYNGTISRIPKAGGSVTVLASSQIRPREIAVDAVNVYWSTHAPDSTWTGVVAAPK